MDDIESLERATLAAVPPQAQEELAGWLLGFDEGTVGRARSAVPLRHAPVPEGVEAEIAQRYQVRGQSPMFRVPDLPAFDGLQMRLVARGLDMTKPTLVQHAAAQALVLPRDDELVDLNGQPDDAWAGVFLGEGFDPVDGASRVAILRRAREAVYARVVRGGQVVAVGTAGLSHGWCGIHGMRTTAEHRGQGLARAILSALAAEALRRGIGRVFLQVEEKNAAARSLYRRAGFTSAWRYHYWS